MPIDIIKPFLDIVDKVAKPAGANGALTAPLGPDAGLVLTNGSANKGQ